jgi:3-hydroxybutyrate dehydrogenase
VNSDCPAVLVTGAASGIGRAIASRLVADGASVLSVDVSPDPDGPGTPFTADLATRGGNRAAVERAQREFGRLDAVIANAGRFIVIASIHSLVASPFKAGYVSAKHGVLGLVKTLALEGAGRGIVAAAICPGYVRTPLVANQIAAQAKAHGISEDEVIRDVMLARQAVRS